MDDGKRFLNAVSDNKRDEVRRLLRQGTVTVNTGYPWGFGRRAPALCVACEYGHFEMAQMLVHEFGARVEVQDDDYFGKRPLHGAAIRGHLEIVQWLVAQHGAAVDVTNKYGRTPLYWASYYSHPLVVQFLLERGASPTVRDKGGETPLSVAGSTKGGCWFSKESDEDSMARKKEIQQIFKNVAAAKAKSTALRPASSKSKKPAVFRSAFMDILFDAQRRAKVLDTVAAYHFLQELVQAVAYVPEVKIAYSILRCTVQQDVLEPNRGVELLQVALDKVANRCYNRDVLVEFQIILNKCHADGWIQEQDYLNYNNVGLNTQIENAKFVVDLRTVVAHLVARVNHVEARLDTLETRVNNLESSVKQIVRNMQDMNTKIIAVQRDIITVNQNVHQVNGSLNRVKSGLKFKMRMDGIVDMVSGVLGAVSMGIGGVFGSIVKPIFSKVVDFSDIFHIAGVIKSQIKDSFMSSKLVESLNHGSKMAENGAPASFVQDLVDIQALGEMASDTMVGNAIDKQLEDALKDGKPLFPLTVIGYAAMTVTMELPVNSTVNPPVPAGTKQGTKEVSSHTASSSGGFDLWKDAIFDDDTEDNALYLHQAVKYSDAKTLTKKLQSGGHPVDVNALDSQDRTAMDLAALTGQLELLELLEAAGGEHNFRAGKMPSVAKKRSTNVEAYRRFIEQELE